jgi:lysophospholipase L1-like esterase
MKKLFFSVFFTVVISLVSILLLEGALWLFHPLPFSPLACRYPYRNNIKGLKPFVVYERNDFGLRSVSLAKATTNNKAPHTIRILCIGASTTDQLTQNTEDLWSSLLESRLKNKLADTGFRIEVAAYGRGGDTVSDTVAWVQKNLVSFSPDIVVTLLGINDLCWGSRSPIKNIDAQHTRQGPDDDFFSTGYPQWQKTLRAVSQIYRHISKIREGLAIRNAIKSGAAIPWAAGYLPIVRNEYKKYPYVECVTRNPDPLEEFGKIVCSLLDYLNSQHIITIVLAQPVLWQKKMQKDEMEALWFPVTTAGGYARASTEWLEQEMGKYNQAQQKCADKKSCIYIPLDALIPKTTEVFFDDCHFTDRGNQLVAEALYPVLLTETEKLIARYAAAR